LGEFHGSHGRGGRRPWLRAGRDVDQPSTEGERAASGKEVRAEDVGSKGAKEGRHGDEHQRKGSGRMRSHEGKRISTVRKYQRIEIGGRIGTVGEICFRFFQIFLFSHFLIKNCRYFKSRFLAMYNGSTIHTTHFFTN
jgi:hypothetical protein